jgi:2,4-dienoyl-CoA reductase-like NADH-dependent reductase (Old Yellow Enzyme family)
MKIIILIGILIPNLAFAGMNFTGLEDDSMPTFTSTGEAVHYGLQMNDQKRKELIEYQTILSENIEMLNKMNTGSDGWHESYHKAREQRDYIGMALIARANSFDVATPALMTELDVIIFGQQLKLRPDWLLKVKENPDLNPFYRRAIRIAESYGAGIMTSCMWVK